MYCSGPLTAHFGVDSSHTYDIRVVFPSGRILDTLNVHPTQLITLTEPTTSSISLHLKPGWNLISLPVETTVTVDEVLSGIIDCYGYDTEHSRYAPSDSIEPLKGYFVLSLVDTIYHIREETITSGVCELRPGWNLLGVPYTLSSFPVADLEFDPEEYIIHQAWWYDPDITRYIIEEELRPTKGYWFLSLEEGTITFPEH